MIVRQYQETDVDDVLALLQACGQSMTAVSWNRDLDEPGERTREHTYVVHQHGDIVGCMRCCFVAEGDRDTVYVYADVRPGMDVHEVVTRLYALAIRRIVRTKRPFTIVQHVSADDAALCEVLAGMGFRPSIRLQVMERPLGDHMPPVVEQSLVRRASVGDAQQIVDLYDRAFSWRSDVDGGNSEESIRYAIEQAEGDELHLVMETGDGVLAGCAHGVIVNDSGTRVGVLYTVAVQPSMQGTGLGRALVQACMHWWADMGVNTARLSMESDNPTAAMYLYQRMGFTVMREKVRYKMAIEDAGAFLVRTILANDPWRMEVLRTAATLLLPDWWISAGFLRSAIWDHLHDKPGRTSIADVDVVYFDPHDIDETKEKALEALLRRRMPEVPWSVKNQARMHVVNGQLPYASSLDAVSRYPETVTALAVRLCDGDSLDVRALWGWQDVLHMRVRPTPDFGGGASRLHEVYARRVREKSWSDTWPDVHEVHEQGDVQL